MLTPLNSFNRSTDDQMMTWNSVVNTFAHSRTSGKQKSRIWLREPAGPAVLTATLHSSFLIFPLTVAMLTKYYSYELCFRPWETQQERERERGGEKERMATPKHPEVEQREEEARSLITSISQRARVPVSTWALSQRQSQKRSDIILTQQTVYSSKQNNGTPRHVPAWAENRWLLISQRKTGLIAERCTVYGSASTLNSDWSLHFVTANDFLGVSLFSNAQVRHLIWACMTCATRLSNLRCSTRDRK